jgi:hypothetical protein
VPQSVSAATDLDLISYLKAIPDARMRRGVRIPAWYLLLVAVLGILSKCESLRDLERFARRHHAVLTESLGIELKRPPSDSAFRYFFLQVDVVAVCAAIRDWTIAQIPGGAGDLDQLICDGKTLRPWVWRSLRPATPLVRTMSGRSSRSCLGTWILRAC